MTDVFIHDPDATKTYTWDWSDWLPTGETISTATITPQTGLTAAGTTIGPTAVTTRLSATQGTLGARTATCRITTTGSQTMDWTITLIVEPQ